MAYYNNAICDIYIGKGAGKKLIDDIENAKKSVKIVSPYLSPSMVTSLINLHKKGIFISLITSDDIEDYYNSYEKNIYQLIIQERKIDIQAENLRNKWIKIYKYLTISLIFLILLFFFYQLQFLYIVIPIIILSFIILIFIIKIKCKQIYFYKYNQLFPFKVYTSYHKSKNYNDSFIHGKIYIIDDKIAYMGSLNFTESGTKYNQETRIRTTDESAVKVIVNEFDNIFNNSYIFSEKNIQDWGKRLYREPIN